MGNSHWHLSNGLSGYIPDNVEVYEDKEGAKQGAIALFADCLCYGCRADLERALDDENEMGIRYVFNEECLNRFGDFTAKPEGMEECNPGAGYVTIESCDDDCDPGDD